VRLSPIDYSIADLDVAKQIYGPRTAYEKVNIKISQKKIHQSIPFEVNAMLIF
jgi:hypothetical protein